MIGGLLLLAASLALIALAGMNLRNCIARARRPHTFIVTLAGKTPVAFRVSATSSVLAVLLGLALALAAFAGLFGLA
jgi:inner membrane protein involved in colicin E2 resistance